jgi:hypothetical protein
VADYLIAQGVPGVTPDGKGETAQFSGSDLSQNRRAVLNPPPPAAPAAPATTKPGKLSMRDPKPVVGKKDQPPDLGVPDKIKDEILNEKPKPKKPMTKDEFVKEVTDFLKELAKQQGSTDGKVKSTDKVWQVDIAVNQGLGGTRGPTKRGGEGGLYDPAELARKITKDLPDPVPEENVKRLRRLKPIDVPVDLTLKDHLHKKWKEFQGKVHKVIDDLPVLPQKAKDYLKKKFDEAVKDGAEWILDKALEEVEKEVKVPEDVKKKIKEYYQEQMKDIMEGEEEEKKK